MNVKTRLAVMVGRLTQWFLQTFTNGGSSLPGKVATKINPDLLRDLAKDYEVVIITGTNGKTVTTSMAVNILMQKYQHVMTNDTGSNMLQGVVSSFLQDAKHKKDKRNLAVLEVDEASLRRVTEYIQPKAILINNLFPDQMDRNGTPEEVYEVILEGIAKTPNALLMLNGDAPILNSRLLTNSTAFFGFAVDDQTEFTTDQREIKIKGQSCPRCGTQINYQWIIYSDLGDYYCPSCGWQRPRLDNKVNEIMRLTTESASFKINDYPFSIPVAGLYNIYNALAAYSIGRYFGVDEPLIAQGLQTITRMFGRQEIITINEKDVRMNLVKNAVGLNEVINLMALEEDDFSLIIILNDNFADGRDISWIQAGDFEKISKMPVKDLYVSGTRETDLSERLVAAGFTADQLRPLSDSKAIIEAIKHTQTDKVYLLTSYTSMLNLREEMYEQGLVKSKLKAE